MFQPSNIESSLFKSNDEGNGKLSVGAIRKVLDCRKAIFAPEFAQIHNQKICFKDVRSIIEITKEELETLGEK